LVSMQYLKYLKGYSPIVARKDVFKSQLNELAFGCKEAFELLPKLEVEEKQLIKFLKACDACRGRKTEYIRQKEKNLLSGHLLVGIHTTTVSLSPFSSYFDMNGLEGGQIGFGVYYFIGRTNRRLAFYNELLLFDQRGESTETGPATFGYPTEIKYKTLQLGLSNMASIRLTRAAIAPTLKLGVFHNFAIAKSASFRRMLSQSLWTETASLNDKIQPYDVGFAGAFGLQYRRFGLEFRYFLTEILYNNNNDQGRTKFYGLQLTYLLF